MKRIMFYSNLLFLADLNVQQVRQLYFEMKEKVFGTARFGYCCDTEAKEKLLKKVFGDRRMLPLENGPKYEHAL